MAKDKVNERVWFREWAQVLDHTRLNIMPPAACPSLPAEVGHAQRVASAKFIPRCAGGDQGSAREVGDEGGSHYGP